MASLHTVLAHTQGSLFEFVALDDNATCSSVSKRWNTLCNDDWLWRRRHARAFGVAVTARVLATNDDDGGGGGDPVNERDRIRASFRKLHEAARGVLSGRRIEALGTWRGAAAEQDNSIFRFRLTIESGARGRSLWEGGTDDRGPFWAIDINSVVPGNATKKTSYETLKASSLWTNAIDTCLLRLTPFEIHFRRWAHVVDVDGTPATCSRCGEEIQDAWRPFPGAIRFDCGNCDSLLSELPYDAATATRPPWPGTGWCPPANLISSAARARGRGADPPELPVDRGPHVVEVGGYFTWYFEEYTAAKEDAFSTHMQGCVGRSGREYVCGLYHIRARRLLLIGTHNSDSGHGFLGIDTYDLSVSETGLELRGVARGHLARWTNETTATHVALPQSHIFEAAGLAGRKREAIAKLVATNAVGAWMKAATGWHGVNPGVPAV